MTPDYKLVVVQPFGSYRRGDVIHDNELVEIGHHERHVRRVPLSAKESLVSDSPSVPVVENSSDETPIEIKTIADVPNISDEHHDQLDV